MGNCENSTKNTILCYLPWVEFKNLPMNPKIASAIFLTAFLFACQKQEKPKRLQLLSPERTAITFENSITENDSINVVNFQYCYNGGGVGIGDFNKDGLPDVLLTGNQVSSELYLNLGNLAFKNITKPANLITNSWVTGVSIVDINADGWDDIYLSVGGSDCKNNCPNLLFIHQGLSEEGIPRFSEMANAYGLADANYGQQAVFFDFDDDGDLDVYVLRNGNSRIEKNNPIPKNYMPPHLKDAFYRNDRKEGVLHPVFTDISKEVGIDHTGFGLGIGINDFNSDGLIDIYVANDFITDDLLYIQMRHQDSLAPWFEERSKTYLAHTTFNSMGMDFGDINDDSHPDVLVVDMLPKTYKRQKKMLGSTNYEKYLLTQRNDYNPQYVRNTLQLHNGFLDGDPLKPSEVAFQKGLADTDWSWAPLMLDLDNDADKDIYISNGYVKDVTDLDYINYSSVNNIFGTLEDRRKKQIEFTNGLDSIYLPNFIFENNGNTNFDNVSDTWVVERPSYSNGTAYADLDLDGDLDLIINNINESAFVYENTTDTEKTKRYLQLQLQGTEKNAKAIGAKIIVWDEGRAQYHFQSVVRGYLSSVSPIVHFGVSSDLVDSLKVVWPNGYESRMTEVTTNQRLSIDIENAKQPEFKKVTKEKVPLKKVNTILKFTHQENPFNEYSVQHLLTKQYSHFGPCLAVGNSNKEAGDELFIGGSVGQPGQLWAQGADGEYHIIQELDAVYEDTDAAFADIDGDGYLDLYVASGGTENRRNSEKYFDRWYQNDGSGYFSDAKIISDTDGNTRCILPFDMDHDGDLDWFVGMGHEPGKYPKIQSSKLLENRNGQLIMVDIPELQNLGIVTDAVWADIDGDAWEDLIVVGEWMPITILKNNQGSLEAFDVSFSKDGKKITTNAWWRSLVANDFDKDGDIDFVIGNQGENWFMKPTQEKPLLLYNGDFDSNESPDPILGYYYEDEKIGTQLKPLHTRDDVMNQLSGLKKQYLNYDRFTEVNYEQLLNIKNLERETIKATTFESVFVENLGNEKFNIVSLPPEAQVAPINTIYVQDFNDDGWMDVALGGNDLTAETLYGNLDAFNGLLLLYSKDGFQPLSAKKSGFYVPGQVSAIQPFTDFTGRPYLLATQNNAKAEVFELIE